MLSLAGAKTEEEQINGRIQNGNNKEKEIVA